MDELLFDDYFFDTDTSGRSYGQKYFIVICYDIYDNKRRLKFVKYLEQYAYRVQRSVFEAFLTKKSFLELKSGISAQIDIEDSVKVYKLTGNGDVYTWGTAFSVEDEEAIII